MFTGKLNEYMYGLGEKLLSTRRAIASTSINVKSVALMIRTIEGIIKDIRE